MYKKDSNWANLAYRVTDENLSDSERDIIKAQTEVLLEQFLKNKKKIISQYFIYYFNNCIILLIQHSERMFEKKVLHDKYL